MFFLNKFNLYFIHYYRGEKRENEDTDMAGICKKLKKEDDLSEEVVSEVVATITDPSVMVGPETLFSENAARDEAAKVYNFFQFK